MNRKSLVVMWAAIILLAFTWIYPPAWGSDTQNGISHDFLSTLWASGYYIEPNYHRMRIMDGLIVLVSAGLIITFRKSN